MPGLMGEGGKADVWQSTAADVVKAQQRQLFWDRDMEFRRGGHDAQGHRVAGRENSGLRQIREEELAG